MQISVQVTCIKFHFWNPTGSFTSASVYINILFWGKTLSILCRVHSVETYLPLNAYNICFNFIIVWIRLQTPRYREELNIQSPPPLPRDCFYAGVTPSLATLLSRHESHLIHENLPKFWCTNFYDCVRLNSSWLYVEKSWLGGFFVSWWGSFKVGRTCHSVR